MKWKITDSNYQPNEKYLYITQNKQWLLVREKGTIPISRTQYEEMLLNGMPDIFKGEV